MYDYNDDDGYDEVDNDPHDDEYEDGVGGYGDGVDDYDDNDAEDDFDKYGEILTCQPWQENAHGSLHTDIELFTEATWTLMMMMKSVMRMMMRMRMMMIMRMMMVGIFTTEAAELRQAGVRHTSKAPE